MPDRGTPSRIGRRRALLMSGGLLNAVAVSNAGCAFLDGESAASRAPLGKPAPLPAALKPLASDPIPVIAKPAGRAKGYDLPSFVDPVYEVPVYRATDRGDFPGATQVRHNYSRRQAWNADRTRYLAMTSNGYWLLYDAQRFLPLSRRGYRGALRGLASDCEPIWHPTDPTKLWYMTPANGLVWMEKDVERDTDEVLFDLRGRLPWKKATMAWTKGEGSPSADGRLFALMATSYDMAAKQNHVYGLLTFDRSTNRIVGMLNADRFGGAFPDHISMAPSGRYAVPSWAHNRELGTRAYVPDFSSFVQLHDASEHSDLALAANGEDIYVVTDYDKGVIRAVEISTRKSWNILPIYTRSGAAYAAHVSGQAFDRPGWVVISTYGDSADYDRLQPDPQLQPMHRKVILVELVPNGRLLSVTHTRTASRYAGYAGEPQATISRDGSLIMFATNFDDGGLADSYVVRIPPL